MAGLARKLGITPGQRVCLLDATPATAALVRAACGPDVAFDDDVSAGRYDAILAWPRTLDGLPERLAILARRVVPDGAIWIVIPKKPAARARGLGFTWEEMQATALAVADLVDNKVASLSDEEYATRFVIRKGRRGDYA